MCLLDCSVIEEEGRGVNLVTKSFEKMAEFRYMAVRPTSGKNIKEEMKRKLRFRGMLVIFRFRIFSLSSLSTIVQVKGYKTNYSSSVCRSVGYMCEIWSVKHRWLVSAAGRKHHSEALLICRDH
jgi:hypothetical protein